MNVIIAVTFFYAHFIRIYVHVLDSGKIARYDGSSKVEHGCDKLVVFCISYYILLYIIKQCSVSDHVVLFRLPLTIATKFGPSNRQPLIPRNNNNMYDNRPFSCYILVFYSI